MGAMNAGGGASRSTVLQLVWPDVDSDICSDEEPSVVDGLRVLDMRESGRSRIVSSISACPFHALGGSDCSRGGGLTLPAKSRCLSRGETGCEEECLELIDVPRRRSAKTALGADGG
jgi:hypothetical protein